MYKAIAIKFYKEMLQLVTILKTNASSFHFQTVTKSWFIWEFCGKPVSNTAISYKTLVSEMSELPPIWSIASCSPHTPLTVCLICFWNGWGMIPRTVFFPSPFELVDRFSYLPNITPRLCYRSSLFQCHCVMKWSLTWLKAKFYSY